MKKEENFEDLEFEKTEEVVSEESLAEKVKSLRKRIKELETESKTNLDGWQRARAELINKDKQFQSERSEIYKSSTAGIIEDLIPVLDSYSMAKKNKEAWEKVEQNWRVGVEYIFSQFSSVLEANGLKTVEPKLGSAFDVNTMHAIEEVGTGDEKLDHTVSEVIQNGYELNGKLLREAKVKIYIKK